MRYHTYCTYHIERNIGKEKMRKNKIKTVLNTLMCVHAHARYANQIRKIHESALVVEISSEIDMNEKSSIHFYVTLLH